jgi:3D (Asp-Asp-Asp) domain-containing protein
MNLVAADSRVLPLGSMVSIPGYDEGRIVPVLDRGGAIKGNRLDVLFSSHDTALRWGSRRLKITVWGPADGQPADDYRRFRDSRD